MGDVEVAMLGAAPQGNMPRRASSSAAAAPRRKTVAKAALRHVVESESECDDGATIVASTLPRDAAAEDAEMAEMEMERERRFQDAEKELLDVLECDGISEHVRKRQLTRLFDRFRYEYTQLSTRFREALRMQRKIMEKCMEMKNELVMSAIKIKTAKQTQEEEMKNLVYYRDECEHAWKAMKACEERERDAVRVIDELKAEIEGLQVQVKTLLGPEPPSRVANNGHKTQATAPESRPTPLSPVKSPSKRLPTAAVPLSPGKPHTAFAEEVERLPILSFEEWKHSTRVWSPLKDRAAKAPTPTAEEWVLNEKRHEITRCVSVPTLQPTAMERATTALPSSRPRERLEERPRASTSNAHKRTTSTPQPLPSVATRKPSTSTST